MGKRKPEGIAASSVCSPRSDGALSIPQLAHELNSLLDGSLRSLGLAERALGAADPSGPDAPSARRHVRSARRALAEIVTVLERAMRNEVDGVDLLHSDRRLDEVVRRVESALRASAAEAGVEMVFTVSADAAGVSAGPLESVLSNGLRNAIQACAGDGLRARRVETTIAVSRRSLVIAIADTGPGLPEDLEGDAEGHSEGHSGGHGIGLGVCRRIVRGLGGTLRLGNAPSPGGGAVMEIDVPLWSLTSDG